MLHFWSDIVHNVPCGLWLPSVCVLPSLEWDATQFLSHTPVPCSAVPPCITWPPPQLLVRQLSIPFHLHHTRDRLSVMPCTKRQAWKLHVHIGNVSSILAYEHNGPPLVRQWKCNEQKLAVLQLTTSKYVPQSCQACYHLSALRHLCCSNAEANNAKDAKIALHRSFGCLKIVCQLHRSRAHIGATWYTFAVLAKCESCFISEGRHVRMSL